MESWRASLAKGSHVDVLDCQNIWCRAEIIDFSPTEVMVHYIGWSSQWDETLPRDSFRIALSGTRAAKDTSSAALRSSGLFTGLSALNNAYEQEDKEKKEPVFYPVKCLVFNVWDRDN